MDVNKGDVRGGTGVGTVGGTGVNYAVTRGYTWCDIGVVRQGMVQQVMVLGGY